MPRTRAEAAADFTGTRHSNAIHPLHATVMGGWADQWLASMSGLLASFSVTTGFLFRRSCRPDKRA